MNRTVIYARVSTEDQLERYGLPTQIRACREYAEKNGLTVIAEPITDDGISGTILDRPGLEKVRRMARERQIDAVLMLDVDRLSRDLAHLLILKPEIERTARLEFVTAKFEDSPSGRMFFGIRGVIGQYERELTRERTMRGRKERARAGLIVGGRVPYGYLYTEGRLTEDPANAPAVRRIFAEYEAGNSMRSIALGLRASGIRTWKGQGKWGKSSVGRILANETYAGVAHYGTHRREGKILRLRDAADRISVIVPALVSREQWERVQARLASNPYVGRPSSRFLLRGVLNCGVCGRRMSGEKSGSYRCLGRDPLRLSGEPCQNKVKVAALDTAAWKALSRMFTDVEFLRETLERRGQELRSVQPAQIEELRRRAVKLRRKEESAMSLMLDPDMIDRRAEIKAEYKAAAAERRQVETELANLERAGQPTGEGWLEETVQSIRVFIVNATAELRQQFVRRLIDRAEWDGEEIKMTCFIAPELATSSARCSQFGGLQVVVKARLAA